MNTFRAIECEVCVKTDIQSVWDAWTTSEGVITFFAPAANIELFPGGPYEILFDPAAIPGEQGAEGMRVLAVQQPTFLSFTWNAPPHLPDVRGQLTIVEIRLSSLTGSETLVQLRHGAWGNGGQWEDAYNYFSRAWPETVLPRLKYSFETAPLEWSNPPQF